MIALCIKKIPLQGTHMEAFANNHNRNGWAVSLIISYMEIHSLSLTSDLFLLAACLYKLGQRKLN